MKPKPREVSATLITGEETIVTNNWLIGFCSNKTHKGYLTKELLYRHKCIEKRCPYLQKRRVPFWKYNEKRLKERARKYNESMKNFVDTAQRLADNIGLNIKILSAGEREYHKYLIYYVPYLVGNDSDNYDKLIEALGKAYNGYEFTLFHAKLPDGTPAVAENYRKIHI